MRVAGSVALCAALLTATAALPDSLTYHNDRFGTEVTFPAEVFSRAEPAPDNGDGMTWKAGDGASLAVFGSLNVDALSPADYLDQQIGWLAKGTDVAYRRAGKDWAVVSGTQGETAFYQRFAFGADAVHSVLLRYPVSGKAEYDPLAGPIAGSLRGP